MNTMCFVQACIVLLVATNNVIVAEAFINNLGLSLAFDVSAHTRQLRATVFYPDEGDDDYASNEFYAASTADITSKSSDEFIEAQLTQLADRLFSDEQVSLLARLASAFSPPGHSIDLSNINSVRCLYVDTKHLEIEAVVCDDYECSSLLIPVDFPIECNLDDGLEDCVVNNVHSLEQQGDDLIRERKNAVANEEDIQKAYDVLQLVGGTSDSHWQSSTKLPEWWVPPISQDVAECDMILNLLNQADWQNEMRRLCMHVLQESCDPGISYDDEVQLALVKAVGPVGMVLEATVSCRGRSVYDDGGINNVALKNVSIKFGSDGDSGGASIRDNILQVVSSINV